MLGAENSFLRSKFARRIFLLFILSAIIPVVLVAILSYSHTAAQLRDQSNRQSMVISKNLGMEILDRLIAAEKELLAIGDSLRIQHVNSAYGPVNLASDVAPAFSTLAVIPGNGEDSLTALSDEQHRQLAAGRSVISLPDGAGIGSDILMIHTLVPGSPERGLLAGTVNPAMLWGLEDFLSEPDQLVVLDDSGRLIHGSRQTYQSIQPTIKHLLEEETSGHLVWHADGEKNLATYWSLFTRSGFFSPDLIFVLSRPESIVLAPVRNFRTLYVPLLVLAVLLVSLISAREIRRKLVPLATLLDATQRVAKGDLGRCVNITTDDEFAVLGDAFNIMTGRLDAQFTSISTMVEIDRLILSSFDARFIISTVLGRIGELTPCTMAALLEFDEEGNGRGKLSIRNNTPDAAIEEDYVQLAEQEVRQLYENPGHLVLQLEGDKPSYTHVFNQSGVEHILLFPTFIKQLLSSVIMFGYSDPPDEDEESRGSLRKLADHVAIALSNSGWEERLYHQAHYDTLTNLPNRALLKDRLEQAIARAQRSHSIVGVFFLDLDHFKLVNDSLGHATGDVFLKSVANALQASVRDVDTVVRFGGDEFIVIVPDVSSQDDVVSDLGIMAKKILNAIQTEFRFDNHVLHPKVSIGIAAYPKDGHVAEELIRNADAAMYLAKNNGRSRYEFFAPELNAIASHRLKMEQELRDALVNDEFVMHYQPKVDCQSSKLAGAEALIRWHHPERGEIRPDEFIGIAEETGLILDIGKWIISTVCRQITTWRQAGLNPVPVAINASARQFGDSGFCAALFDILDSAGVNPGMIELEITESMVMKQTEVAIGKLDELRARGLRLSMDDFGTGYSSLNYLRRLPIHTLKIDKSFIDELVTDRNSYAIVSATVFLAHKLGIEVVAEGVESGEQQHLLQCMQCDTIQGYLISKALPADRFAEQFLGEQYRQSRARVRI